MPTSQERQVILDKPLLKNFYEMDMLFTEQSIPVKECRPRLPKTSSWKRLTLQKNPKHIVSIEVTNTYPGGYWENQGYNWFGGS